MNLNPAIEYLKKMINGLTVIGAVIGGFFTAVMTIIVFYAVIGRYILNQPVGWSEEYAMYFMAWAVFLGAAYTLREDAHIGVDLVTSRLKPGIRKSFMFFNYVVGIIFFSILFYKGIQMVSFSILTGARSIATDFPEYIAHLSVPVGAVILILQCLNKLLTLNKENDRSC